MSAQLTMKIVEKYILIKNYNSKQQKLLFAQLFDLSHIIFFFLLSRRSRTQCSREISLSVCMLVMLCVCAVCDAMRVYVYEWKKEIDTIQMINIIEYGIQNRTYTMPVSFFFAFSCLLVM